MHNLRSILLSSILVLITSCKETAKEAPQALVEDKKIEESQVVKKVPLSKDFKTYWYNGEAEITSFELSQERYGELREGTAVLIYVTEDFLPDAQVKADNYDRSNIPILKLNSTKKFTTGIYPYSIMESCFYPVGRQSHALKVSASIQEWCGQVYAQINNRNSFEVRSHSYFESEGDQSFEIEKTYLENEVWNLLRIDPTKLPQGDLQMIPSLEYSRLRHRPIKAFTANAILTDSSYTLSYPELGRKLVINYNAKFPHEILGWEETNTRGYGADSRVLNTTATRMKTIRSPYWSKNKNSDLSIRKELMLD